MIGQDHQDLRRTITNIIHGKALQWELSPDTFRNVAQKLYPDAGRLLVKLKDKDRQKNLLSDAEQLLHAAGGAAMVRLADCQRTRQPQASNSLLQGWPASAAPHDGHDDDGG